MADFIDSKMPQEQQEQARQILRAFNLDNLKIHYDANKKHLVFDQDRRVVTVPIELIKNNAWADIRFLFRAILGSANSLWNSAADDNDWSGTTYYGKS